MINYKWRTYDRFAMDLVIILGQTLKYFDNQAPSLIMLPLRRKTSSFIITYFVHGHSNYGHTQKDGHKP